jgi:regulator of nucleoside diphosphate kinase
MIARDTVSPSLIMITGADFDRLSRLVQSPRYRTTHPTMLEGLKDELARGAVVAPSNVHRSVVTMNSRVRLRDLRTGEHETYTLVYPEEADINDEKLSVLAPLGTALLGSRTGQTIVVNAPGGRRRLKVERILYQPEAAGDYHL